MQIIVQACATAQIGCRSTPQPDLDPPWVTTRWPRPKLTLMRLSRPYAHCRDMCGPILRLFAAYRLPSGRHHSAQIDAARNRDRHASCLSGRNRPVVCGRAAYGSAQTVSPPGRWRRRESEQLAVYPGAVGVDAPSVLDHQSCLAYRGDDFAGETKCIAAKSLPGTVDFVNETPPLAVPTLEADPFRLRPVRLFDLDAMWEASQDERIPSITTVSTQFSEEEGHLFIERQWQRAADGTGYSFAIADAVIG